MRIGRKLPYEVFNINLSTVHGIKSGKDRKLLELNFDTLMKECKFIRVTKNYYNYCYIIHVLIMLVNVVGIGFFFFIQKVYMIA